MLSLNIIGKCMHAGGAAGDDRDGLYKRVARQCHLGRKKFSYGITFALFLVLRIFYLY